jgi:hypothetical protein
MERVGRDFSMAASSAAETAVDLARISIRAALWVFNLSSSVVNGMLLCEMAGNSWM